TLPLPCAPQEWKYDNPELKKEFRFKGIYWEVILSGRSPMDLYEIRFTVSCGPLTHPMNPKLRRAAFLVAQTFENRLASQKDPHPFYSKWRGLIDKETEQFVSKLMIVRKMGITEVSGEQPYYRFFWMIRPERKEDHE
ncbi:MAG: hypothetical protein JRJ59_04415, partial [Deltaproteobacteria bacterium]|nr:hypothetical protein [Deltaproteobacteria bacterium]